METPVSLDKEAATKKSELDHITRFSVNQRVQHVLLMVSFVMLSVTGLSQRFYASSWGLWFILRFGGIENTRLIHRGFGLLFTLIVLYHLGYLAYSLFVRHSKLTMIPTLKDFRDIVTTLKYSFGFAARPPQFGRFSYNQKFEYWGMVFGGFVIIATGFILAFPLLVTRVFPGQVVAASVEFHGYEATLAVIVIIIWHLYDVILRPGIFPADTSVFTGTISKKRMLEEHPLEYVSLIAGVPNDKTDILPSEEASG